MADEQNKTDSLSTRNFIEKRREDRYAVSTIYQRYLELRIKAGNDLVPVVMDNFSRHGILFESPVPFDADAHVECLISISRSLSKDIAFKVQIRHCLKKENIFIIGAAIETVADSTWFDIFVEVHNFIVQRQGTIF